MAFDHAQSARLGQRTPVENPGVQVCTLETLPEVAYRGQIVYLIDRNAFGVYDGDAWIVAGGSGGGGGESPGSVVFVQSTEPFADAIGNQWLNTIDYQLYVWDGQVWQATAPTAQVLNNDLSLQMALAVARRVPKGTELEIVIRYQGATPASAKNDFWVNTATNTTYIYDGTSHIQVSGEDGDAIRLAGNRRATGADLEIHLYYDVNPPMGLTAEDIGDVWHYETIQVWSGARWADLLITGERIADKAVDTVHINTGAVDTPQLRDSSIINSKIDLFAIENHNISNFAVSVTKMKTFTHMIL